jgi:hypothetical protein
MPLTVTPGAPDADSYATLLQADAYAEARGWADWTGEDELKERALRRAVEWLDAGYLTRWPGRRANGRAQRREWPRIEAVDASGDDVDAATIPDEVVAAQIEAALRELIVPNSLTPDYVPGRTVRREQVGPLSVEYLARGDLSAVLPTLTSVDNALAPLIGQVGATRFLSRA